MKIQELFQRDIHRSINGVVKADQLDDSSVWQELDEFVITIELTKHLEEMVRVLLAPLDSGEDTTGQNGIWISGFFGSGKSHLIKVLSYLLENQEHTNGDLRRQAVEFFEDKLDSAMLFADLKRVVAIPTDTILFNIDSKADHRSGRDALLQVFLKVLNEKQGYSSDHPHIAHLERHLEESGKLAGFHAAFAKESGEPWLEQRDAWEFHRDEVVTALEQTLGQSKESVEKWVDGGERHFSLTIENFAKWVKRYLDDKGPQQRLMFLVDEVGQFIGDDTHLMLNLQTITEQLGTVCDGRAWVVVTSQEDLDSVLGDLKNTKKKDFSKIQGRFETRLSLSSINVDEVIKERLLDKNPNATVPLAQAYEGKHDILRNQLSFVKAGSTFKHYTDSDDFTACYPFAAYQFSLVQKVFESIRKAGATGLHLSQGERSILDAFQSAAKQVGDQAIGALVPFYRFYPAVEGFLDTAVKRTIDNASDNLSLQPFDSIILKVLFLIRYIDEVPGSVDNLVTLCVNEIDTDKLALRKEVETSLARLERETLIARNGDIYLFLTNEERDIGREIKNVTIPSGAEERELGKLIFEDILGDVRKHTYGATGRDFSFTRTCDDHTVGTRLEGSLEVTFVTPLGDSYADLTDDAKCVLKTSGNGIVLIRISDRSNLDKEIRTYIQTDSYVKTKNTASLQDTTKRILQDQSHENRSRRKRIVQGLQDALEEASYFASGKKLEVKRPDPKAALHEALEYLIKNAYPKMNYIEHLNQNPKQEIQSTLRANDVDQVTLQLATAEANAQALDDLREYIRLSTDVNKQIVLHDLAETKYGNRPYGWPELEVVLLIARLAVLKEVDLIVNGAPLDLDQAFDHIMTSSKQRRVTVVQRKSADSALIKSAQNLGHSLFAKQGPGGEDALVAFLKDELGGWHKDLDSNLSLASTGKYPGLREIESGLTCLRPLVQETESVRFLERFVANESELKELCEEVHTLEGFYANQRHTWDRLGNTIDSLSQNRLQLDGVPGAKAALEEMESIRNSDRPYNRLQRVADLTHTASAANDKLVTEAREPVVAGIQSLVASIGKELDGAKAEEKLRESATSELAACLQNASNTSSIAHIAQAREAADAAFDRALHAIQKSQIVPQAGNEIEPALVTKSRRTLTVRKICPSGFLETSEDMESFLASLRDELGDVDWSKERVQIK